MELGDTVQDVVPARKSPILASHFEVYLFGFLIMGKGLTLWHVALIVGYWKFYFIVAVVCLTYFCFMTSLAEMTSVLPFSGGSYGFVRCVLGPFPGFIAGIFESLEYAMFLATCLEIFSMVVGMSVETRRSLDPAYWLVFYGAAIPVLVWGGRWMYRVGALFGLYALAIFCIYIFGSVGEAEMTDDRAFSQYKETPQTVELFFFCLIIVAWLFEGIEVITLTCEATSDPARNMPRTMMASICSVVLLVMATATIFGSIWPGPTWLTFFPMPITPGLQDVLNISMDNATILQVPALFGAGYMYFFAVSKQTHAMANSGLLPAILRKTYGPNESPVYAMGAAMIVCSVVQCSLYFTNNDTYLANMFAICLFSSLPVYILLMVTYLIFARKFTHMQRSFKAPLGSLGALFAMAVFGAILMVFLINMAEDVFLTTIFFSIFAVGVSIYYFVVAQERQCFSTDEQLRFFRVYVANASRVRRRIHAPLKFRHGWQAAVERTIAHVNPSKIFPSYSSASGDSRLVHTYPGFMSLSKPRRHANSNNSSTEDDTTERNVAAAPAEARMLADCASESNQHRNSVRRMYSAAMVVPTNVAEGTIFAQESSDEEDTVQFR